MGVIHILASTVADQIAAGEVVERPASVVKELVENALDAGARAIAVHIDGGGLTRIVVTDDGCGMDPADAVLCFARHATSKIVDASELDALHTIGFRGEALAAISSVCHARLTTKTENAQAATAVVVEFGRISAVKDAGAARGTSIEITALFGNTPARKKFLKATRTELDHVHDVVRDAVLSEPTVAFSLYHDGALVLDAPAVPHDAALDDPGRVQRAVLCLGAQVRPALFPLRASSELLTLTGYVVAPTQTRRDLAGVHLSVNKRPVSDRGLVSAVRTAFRSLLEVGRQPIVALDLAIDPALVDVNVHPRKAEVRFVDARRVSGHVIALLSEFLSKTPWLSPTAGLRTVSLSRALAHVDGGAGLPSAQPPLVGDRAAAHPEASSLAPSAVDAYRGRVASALERFSSAQPVRTAARRHDASLRARTLSSMRVLGHIEVAHDAGVDGAFGDGRTPTHSMLLLHGDAGLVAVALDRAAVCLMRARLTNACALDAPQRPAPRALLVPVQVELSPAQMHTFGTAQAQSAFARVSLSVNVFGPRHVLVTAVPAGLNGRHAGAMTIDAIAAIDDVGLSARAHDAAVCARLAQHATVPAHSDATFQALLAALDAAALSHDELAMCVRVWTPWQLAAWFHPEQIS